MSLIRVKRDGLWTNQKLGGLYDVPLEVNVNMEPPQMRLMRKRSLAHLQVPTASPIVLAALWQLVSSGNPAKRTAGGGYHLALYLGSLSWSLSASSSSSLFPFTSRLLMISDPFLWILRGHPSLLVGGYGDLRIKQVWIWVVGGSSPSNSTARCLTWDCPSPRSTGAARWVPRWNTVAEYFVPGLQGLYNALTILNIDTSGTPLRPMKLPLLPCSSNSSKNIRNHLLSGISN